MGKQFLVQPVNHIGDHATVVLIVNNIVGNFYPC